MAIVVTAYSASTGLKEGSGPDRAKQGIIPVSETVPIPTRIWCRRGRRVIMNGIRGV